MVLTPVMSRARAAAAVSGGAAMVALVGVGFTALPATTAQPASSGPSAAASEASSVSGQSMRLVAQVTLFPASATVAAAHRVPATGGLGGGPGGGPGGGSDGSSGDAVAPSPAKHATSSGSSSSASSGSAHGHSSSAESPGLIAGVFKHVGHWLGLSSDDSKTSGDSVANTPKPAKPAGASSGSASSEGSGGAGAGGAAGGQSADTSGVGDLIHSVFSGIGRLFSGLFGG